MTDSKSLIGESAQLGSLAIGSTGEPEAPPYKWQLARGEIIPKALWAPSVRLPSARWVQRASLHPVPTGPWPHPLEMVCPRVSPHVLTITCVFTTNITISLSLLGFQEPPWNLLKIMKTCILEDYSERGDLTHGSFKVAQNLSNLSTRCSPSLALS